MKSQHVLVVITVFYLLSITVLFHNQQQSIPVSSVSKNNYVRSTLPVARDRALLRSQLPSYNKMDILKLRRRLPPSIWSVATTNSDRSIASIVSKLLDDTEKDRAMELCGKFLYSSIQRAVQVGDMGEQTFVATGDIDSMWTRDSAVQMGIYFGRMGQEPYLRLIVDGAIRRQAFNIIQDPYANAYARKWRDASELPLKDRVIGRGGWVDTRNYELDSGAYFFTQLYDYYVADDLYKPELLLAEPLIFDAVMLMVNTWIVEQNHDEDSPYHYFELENNGKGAKTSYTGMTWTGFRPSDDPSKYGYLVPANIHAAAGLERILELNERIWQSDTLKQKATKLLKDIEEGIRRYGVVEANANNKPGIRGKSIKIYAYEVDGNGKALSDFDDANVPSLLSIPLLGWTGYDKEVYSNTRARLLDPAINKFYFSGKVLRGIGSPHTHSGFVWPLALAIEALTEEGSQEHVAEVMAFQIRQSLTSACNDAMHESVSSKDGCPNFSRAWFEWSNALFVVLIETALGQRCDDTGRSAALVAGSKGDEKQQAVFYHNRYRNDHAKPDFYQGIQAAVKHVD